MTGVDDLRLRILPYAPEHALRLFDLSTHHAAPFDRQIIAPDVSLNTTTLVSCQRSPGAESPAVAAGISAPAPRSSAKRPADLRL
jgi:hypothetical protein